MSDAVATGSAPMAEEDYLPLSGLQHFVFCPRQCALIHVEGLFVENHATVEGRLLHEPVDKPGHRLRDDVQVERAVWLRSDRLKLVGRSDRVEVHRDVHELRLVPVESKRSRRRSLAADSVQLCAQAMALEEMRGVRVREGALYYIRSKRRLTIEFTQELRQRTCAAAMSYHEMVSHHDVPPARLDRRCRLCSMHSVCVPSVTERPGALAGYLARLAERDIGHDG